MIRKKRVVRNSCFPDNLGKRGLSPTIATVLLVSVSLVLAVIIFFWARSFLAENIEKGGQQIELVCEDVQFVAEAIGSTGEITVENIGTVPLFTFEIRKKGTGEITEIADFSGSSVDPGQTASVDAGTIESGETIIVVPVLLGESLDVDEKVPYICDQSYGVEIEVV